MPRANFISSLKFRTSGTPVDQTSCIVAMAAMDKAPPPLTSAEVQANALKFEMLRQLQTVSKQSQVEVTRYFNVQYAKVAVLLMVIGCIVYHGFIRIKYGTDSCHWLLADGRFQGYNAWQPYGCMMHKYTKSDSRNCMHYISYWGGRNHIVFLGDSRIRQLYYEFVNTLSTEPQEPIKAHSDLHFQDKKINLKVDFLWQPMVNESMYNVYKEWLQKGPQDRPNLVVTSSATWSIKLNNATTEARENFKYNLSIIVVQYFNKLKDSVKILWMLQDPVIESMLTGNRSMITNAQVDEYNRAAIEILSRSSVTIWSSSRLVAQGFNKDSQDGLHIGKVGLEWDFQILINMYCNDHMNFNDGTCCSSMEPITVVQIITASLFGLSLVLFLILALWKWRTLHPHKSVGMTPKAMTADRTEITEVTANGSVVADKVDDESKKEEKKLFKWQKAYELTSCLTRLGSIMFYFFLCDRTNFFMKENKYYTHVNFFLPFSYLMILGFFFTENTEQTSVLHRDQTDEWKGWMQLVILIYHLTGASQVLQIYMQIRVLVSAYLFLSGYGHFCYFWNKGDFSLYRFCKVMFRFNFLVVMLCFAMNRPYQFYYFVPLVSFWFMLLYITMALWPQVTAASTDNNGLHYLYLILKVAALVVAITLLYASEVFFEKIFLSHPMKALFVTSDDSIHEWRFRWQLDRYSTVYGLGFAFGLLVSKKLKVIEDSKPQTLFSRGISVFVFLLGVSGMMGYGVFASFCRNKQECNEVHPYISFLPIVSYIILRNLFGWLRTKYSCFFAWFGKISLELFIAQYHIWLAADTHGILVLVPSYPVMNVVVTSFVYVCVSHEICSLTAELADFAIPHDWRLLLRNIVCFVTVLLPIAVTHGVLGI